MSLIPTKADMYKLYQDGRFGNKLRTWTTERDYENSGYTAPVVLRYKGSTGGKWCAYGVAPKDVKTTISKWEAEGASRSLIVFNESAPDDKLILQGEVMRSTEHLSLRYSKMKAPMRVALSEAPLHAGGMKAVSVLKSTMDPESWEDLNTLLDEYDGAVVEFSVWDTTLGSLPRRNTVFWEVRHY